MRILLSVLLVILLCADNMCLASSAYEDEHTHTFACHESWELGCTEPDHIHTLDCYTGSGDLICGLDEGQIHTHNEDGYECKEAAEILACDKDHDHLDDCYTAIYKCRQKNPEGETPSGDAPVDSNAGPSESDPVMYDSEIGSAETDALAPDLNAGSTETDTEISDPNTDPPETNLGTPISTVEELKSGADNGGTYYLSSELTGTISETIAISKDFVLNLNGQTLDITINDSNKNLFEVKSGAIFTLKDFKENGNIKYSGGDNVISVNTGGTLNLEGGSFNTAGCTRAVFCAGTMNMRGGTISGNTVAGGNGGAILLKGGAIEMSGGTISGNTAQNGGGIYAVNSNTSASTVNITGGTISGNDAKGSGLSSNGGGIAVINSTLDVGGTALIERNRAEGEGGGIYINTADSTVSIQGNARIIKNTDGTNNKKSGSISGIPESSLAFGENCIVSGYKEPSADTDELAQFIIGKISVELNKDYETKVVHTIPKGTELVIDLNGHTINAELINDNDNLFVVEGTLTIKDSKGTGETGKVKLSGGDNVISVNSGGTLNLEGGSFDTAGCNRAVFCRGTVNMSGGTISGNTVNGNGGAILLNGGAIDMSGGTISDNHAGKNGGGISAVNSTVTIRKNAVIENNTAEGTVNANDSYGSGGGIYVTDSSVVNITGGKISGNNAKISGINSNTGNGGGIAVMNSTISVGGTALIEKNGAAGKGGGIYINAADGEIKIDGTAQIVKNTDSTNDKRSGSISGIPENKLTFGYDCIVDGYHEYAHSSDSLVDFIRNHNDNGKVTLNNNYTTNVIHTITEGESLEIDLAGYTINASLTNPIENLFNVNGTLTITDSSLGNGQIKLSGGDNVISVNSGGTLNFEGGSFDTTGCNRAVFCAGTMNMTGGKITGNNIANGNGGAILSSGGTINMSGGTISGNTAKNGGGIGAINSTVIISKDAVIENNTAEDKVGSGDSYGSGGGIYAGLNSKVEIQGGSIRNNTAKGNNRGIISGGGGVYAKELTISGGDISNNTAEGYGRSGNGGGVNAVNLTMTDGKISGNKANSGGGIYMRAHTVNNYDKIEAHLTLTGGIIGSDSYVKGRSVQSETASSGNEAGYCGGGIFLDYGVSADIGDTVGSNKLYITGNLAKDKKPSAEVTNASAIVGESHPHGYGGGGIFVEHPVDGDDFNDGAKLYVYNALITNNNARYGGGIAGCGASSLEIFRVMGAGVFGNAIAKNISNNLYYPSSYDIYCEGSGSVDTIMLGGYATKWEGEVDDNHNNFNPKMIDVAFDSGSHSLMDFFLKSEPDDDAKQGVRDLANVFIEGNTCYSGGGGIGGNGLIRLGAIPDICIEKELVYDDEDAELKKLLAEKEFEFKIADENNPSLIYTLKLKGSDLLNGADPVLTKIPEGTYIVTEEGDSAKADGYELKTMLELDNHIADYTSEGQKITITKEMINSGDMITLRFINIYTKPGEPKGHIRINKTVTGENIDSEKEFSFTIGLKDKDGSSLTGAYHYTGDRSGIVHDGGTISLKNGEHIIIEFMPAGSQVSVTEMADSKYTTTATVEDADYVQGQPISIIKDDILDVEFINNIKPTPQNPGGSSDNPPDNPPDKPSEDNPENPSDKPSEDNPDNPDNPPDNPSEENPDNPSDNPSEEPQENPPDNPPGYLTELPDPNDPNSPDTVTIWDDGVPKIYIKVWDPENEEFVYLPEEEVPLINMELPGEDLTLIDGMPATGDNSLTVLWAALAVISLAIIAGLGVLCRKRRDNKKDNT